MRCSTPQCFSTARGWSNLAHEGKPEVCIALCPTCLYMAAKLGAPNTHNLKERT